MPLLSVRALVRHASRHGYMVSAFSAHGADEIQAVVTAAEANRAPAIIALEAPAHTFADDELHMVVAETIAMSATVPIGIEVVTPRGLEERRVARSAMRSNANPQPGASASSSRAHSGRAFVHGDGIAACEIEIWPTATALEDAVIAERIGVIVDTDDSKALHIGTLRKCIARIRSHFAGALVIDGDVTWREGTLPALPKLGVAKINFDHRLRRAMAAANRQAVEQSGHDFRRAMGHVLAALVAEVTECLRRTGSTGRAADVTACADMSDRLDIQAVRAAAPYAHAPVPGALVGTRVAKRDESLTFA